MLSGVTCRVTAQQNDFQAWPSLGINIEVFDDFKVHVEEEIRFIENLSQVGRQINDVGISYRFNKLLKAGLFYRLEADWKNVDEYAWRNVLYSEISARKKIERITFSYRLRVQSNKVEANSEEGLLSNIRHRHKISAGYDIKGMPLFPFLETELFVDYSRSNRSEISGLRTWIGLDYTIKKVHTVSLKYGIDHEINQPDPIRAYIIAFGYSFDLDLKSGK